MAKTVVGSMSDWSGVLKDIFRQIHDGSRTYEQLVAFNEGRNPFDSKVESSEHDPYSALKRKWAKFYKAVFETAVDFSDLHIPPCPEGKWWLIILVKGMTSSRLFGKCQEKLSVWKWTDRNLDEIVISDRSAKNGAYAIWVRANVEADEQFANLSANDLKAQGHKGITLEERLALELFYFWKSGKRLDIQNWTLCSGSRCFDGGVPGVNQDGDQFKVYWYYPVYRNSDLRSREAVS